MAKFTVTLEFDQDAEDPCKWGMYQIVSFSDRHNAFQDPYKYLKPRNKYGEVRAATIGMQRKLDCGTAFILSCYQHSGTVWSLRGEGHQCRWDTAEVAGLIISTSVRDLPKEYDKRAELARSFLDTYNAWCNGSVYGYSIHDEDGEFVDSCWGYFEEDYMLECIRDRLPAGAEIEWDGEAAWLGEYYVPRKAA